MDSSPDKITRKTGLPQATGQPSRSTHVGTRRN